MIRRQWPQFASKLKCDVWSLLESFFGELGQDVIGGQFNFHFFSVFHSSVPRLCHDAHRRYPRLRLQGEGWAHDAAGDVLNDQALWHQKANHSGMGHDAITIEMLRCIGLGRLGTKLAFELLPGNRPSSAQALPELPDPIEHPSQRLLWSWCSLHSRACSRHRRVWNNRGGLDAVWNDLLMLVLQHDWMIRRVAQRAYELTHIKSSNIAQLLVPSFVNLKTKTIPIKTLY